MQRLIYHVILMILLTACQTDKDNVALGTLERDRVILTATANEIIRDLPVQEGSPVTQGQVLVQLDRQRQAMRLAQAVAEQAQAKAYLQKLTNGERPEDIAAAKADVVRAKARFIEAEKNYQRTRELVAKKLSSQSEKDRALASRDTAQAELNAVREAFAKLTAGSRVEDIEQAKAALDAATAGVMLQQHQLNELTIVATRDGVLDSLPYQLGERVMVNQAVAVIEADRVPYARVYVPARYRTQFVTGLMVNVHVDGVEQVFQGKVRRVSDQPSFTPYYALTEEERSRLMYLAEIDLDDSAQSLPSGIPAQVELGGLRP
ncbi:HlyD family secretion protein [Vibrio gazogenes]|uniref:HlyD family secretion protein n=1 Tax=Vibrio gazogenes DSM 21264 = NBRC 103151 TaxID=1123492 RepID=A0A1M4XU87_VIBGA|nr:HlyD family efflux transporter periplasmic adaptor subunit [Vibrio gazogenes]USP12876.1 HlyD family efflux transporter periplasmic adaptor subunit [Vibrio gazogenes]SHE97147.1 HlyD family secretion protein [Vibrio gazogenes DSM 21264] [Vibrio gazogenes DSM 21264 = NBRC 103151]SJN57911.1 putative efflux pump membrane fusion protein [Vibrio gazogenes]